MGKIKIISTQKIEVMRELAYVDRTPDLTNTGAAIISGQSLMRVNTLKPMSYKFVVGANEINDPITFVDPVTRKEVTESVLTWKGVRYLINSGVFEAFTDTGIVTVEKLEKEDEKRAAKAEKDAESEGDDSFDEKTVAAEKAKALAKAKKIIADEESEGDDSIDEKTVAAEKAKALAKAKKIVADEEE